MPADRRTTQAVAEAAARGPGTSDPLLGELRRSGLLPLLVLHFIAEAPSYGNQLMERILTLSGGALAVNPNTMYPLLRSLEARRLVRGEWEHPERRSGCSHSPCISLCASSERSSGYIVFGLTASAPLVRSAMRSISWLP